MFKNYLQIAWRGIRKNPFYSVINVVGLSVGLSLFILIFLFIKNEHDFDGHWQDVDRIYRITETMNLSGQDDPFAVSSFPVAPALKTAFPEVENAVRLMIGRAQTAWYGEKAFNLKQVYQAEADFFEVFDFPFIYGNPATALQEPYTIVLSEQVATRFFGHQNPLGKMLRFARHSYRVTGVYRLQGLATHLNPEVMMSLATLPAETAEIYNSDWMRLVNYSYLKFKPGVNASGFQQKLDDWTRATINPWIKEHELDASLRFEIHPLQSIHFTTRYAYDMPSNTHPRYIRIFGMVAVFVLLIAAINYMNLATARSARRAKEVGVRKVMGAHRRQLMYQFISESMLISFLAFVFGLSLAELFLPAFNHLAGMELSLFPEVFEQGHSAFWLIVLLVVVGVGLLSGSYPAFVLSGFRPIVVLKPGLGHFSASSGRLLAPQVLRRVLVVLQFGISIGLIFCTVVIYYQMQFLRNHDLGFDKEQVVVVKYPADSLLHTKTEVIKSRLMAEPQIEQVAFSGNLPGYHHGRLLFFFHQEGEQNQKTMNLFLVDHDFIDLLSIPMAEGRFFSRDYPEDATRSFVINQAAADFLGFDQPVGQEMMCGLGVEGKIVGVCRNFNYNSLHQQVEPMVLVLRPQAVRHMAVKINGGNLPAALHTIEEQWKAFDRNHPMEFAFLDQQFNQLYEREERMFKIFTYFSVLIILISCMGLFGLAAFTVERRTKEIGIRKVMGGSNWQIIRILIVEFMRLVVLAGLLFTPLAAWYMDSWLTQFAYRISIHWSYFVLSLLCAVGVALLTVVFQAWKAARENPIQALKYE